MPQADTEAKASLTLTTGDDGLRVEVRSSQAHVILEEYEGGGEDAYLLLGQVHIPRDRRMLGELIAHLVAERGRIKAEVAQ